MPIATAKPRKAPASAPSDGARCWWCKGMIDGKRVYTGAGPMHPHCQDDHWAKVSEIVRAAVAAGRHGAAGTWQTVCDGCRQWVNSIVYGLDGKRLCAACAPPDRHAIKNAPGR